MHLRDCLVPTGSFGLSGCPLGKGWEYADGGCVQNSPNAVNIPNVSIKSLSKFTETGDIAKFNKGATITVSLQTDIGLTTAPICPTDSGTTGESNNLKFVTAPADPP